MSAELPKLRSHLEPIPIRRGREVYIALRDLEGLSQETLVLSPQAYFIITLMDGSNSVVDLQTAYMRRFGDILFRENIDALIQKLDSQLFLQNEKSRSRMKQLIAEFRKQTFRPAFHAGISYEADPEKLRAQLQGFFVEQGQLPATRGYQAAPSEVLQRLADGLAPGAEHVGQLLVRGVHHLGRISATEFQQQARQARSDGAIGHLF